jgi:hypothetical protein
MAERIMAQLERQFREHVQYSLRNCRLELYDCLKQNRAEHFAPATRFFCFRDNELALEYRPKFIDVFLPFAG